MVSKKRNVTIFKEIRNVRQRVCLPTWLRADSIKMHQNERLAPDTWACTVETARLMLKGKVRKIKDKRRGEQQIEEKKHTRSDQHIEYHTACTHLLPSLCLNLVDASAGSALSFGPTRTHFFFFCLLLDGVFF